MLVSGTRCLCNPTTSSFLNTIQYNELCQPREDKSEMLSVDLYQIDDATLSVSAVEPNESEVIVDS